MKRLALMTLWVALASFAVGCGDDDTSTDSGVDSQVTDGTPDTDSDTVAPLCSLRVTKINGTDANSVSGLSSADDQDGASPGIQINVEAEIIGKPDGTSVELSVTGLSPKPQATSANGIASFSNVTIDSSFSVVQIRPESTGCAGQTLNLNVQADPSCEILSPADGTTLFPNDDKNPGNSTFDFDIEVQTVNSTPNGVVNLQIGAANQGNQTVSVSGKATFTSAVLAPGPNTITATVTVGGLQSTCQATVTVDISAPACNITGFTPAAISTTQGQGLGPAQDADSNIANGLDTVLGVATENDVDSVELREGGTLIATLAPTGGMVDFPLNLTDGPKAFEATCIRNVTGQSGVSPSANVVVDVTNPDSVPDLNCFVDPATSDNREGVVTCQWQSAQDGSGSGVETYLIRYRENDEITEANWDAPDTVKLTFTPVANVGLQEIKITGLSIPNQYSFAIRPRDFLGNLATFDKDDDPVVLAFKTQQIDGEGNGFFGVPVATGDFNCDGVSDMAIGQFRNAGDLGQVRLFFGNGAGFLSTPSVRIDGTVAGGKFGASLAAVDFNGDNCHDLAVRSSGNRGQAFLYLGRSNWTDRTDLNVGTGAEVTYVLDTSESTRVIATAIAGVNFDGDSMGDLVIRLHNTSGDTAEMNIDYGETGIPLMTAGNSPEIRMMPADAEVRITGGTNSHFFGFPAANVGRIDGAAVAFESLGLGGSGRPAASGGTGAIYIVKGGARVPGQQTITLADPRVILIEAKATNAAFGFNLAGAGDINGDGVADIVATDPFVLEANATGAAYVFNISPLPATAADASSVISNDTPGGEHNFFASVLGNGALIDPLAGADLNNDGRADLLITAGPGGQPLTAVFGWWGVSGALFDRSLNTADLRLRPTDQNQASALSFGSDISFLGDINNDGFTDFVVADPGFNSENGRLIIHF